MVFYLYRAMNCELLEIGLFGNAGSLRTLPFTWLDPKLVDRYTNLEQEDWKLKQKVLQILSQYEEKKKVSSVFPLYIHATFCYDEI